MVAVIYWVMQGSVLCTLTLFYCEDEKGRGIFAPNAPSWIGQSIMQNNDDGGHWLSFQTSSYIIPIKLTQQQWVSSERWVFCTVTTCLLPTVRWLLYYSMIMRTVVLQNLFCYNYFDITPSVVWKLLLSGRYIIQATCTYIHTYRIP